MKGEKTLSWSVSKSFFPLFFLDIPSSVFNPVCPYVRERAEGKQAQSGNYLVATQKKKHEKIL